MKNVQILWVMRNMSKTGTEIKTHTHDYYHMLYLQSGQLDMVVGGHAFVMREKVCVLVPKGVEHSYVVAGNESAEYMEVKFALMDKALDETFHELELCFSDAVAVGELVKQIAEEYSALGMQADETTACYLTCVLHLLARERRIHKQQEFRYVDASAYSPLSQQIVHYLEEHFSRPVSLEQLAQALGKEKSYLCRAFKKDTKTTILDCLNMIRIRRAAELLTYSDVSMAQVGEMCGFASPNNFSRVFLKYVGVTPGQSRRAFPADILLRKKERVQYPNSLIYSVLAQQRIPLEVYLADQENEA